ncbi:MAG: sterol desaturase family protein [Mariprofundaceae bacterium]
MVTEEAGLRFAAFLIIFAIMAIWEAKKPRRELREGKHRWPGNLGILISNVLVLRLLFPAGAIGTALWVSEQGVGLLNLVELPTTPTVIIAIIFLDLAIYAQHVAIHFIPPLWRLHMVHHADHDIDVSTGLRFHPLEILLSMLIKMVVIALIGAPVIAVVAFEIILNGMAMFNHANVRLPTGLDHIVRMLLVTPDMHRVHHSDIKQETNSNFGFNLSIWDRMFRTYQAQPILGHDQMNIGIEHLQQAPTSRFYYMLKLPFLKRKPMHN